MKVGVLGGGQLARMLALAGLPMGCEFTFLAPDPRPCAMPLGRHLHAEYADESALERLAGWADVVTFEFENVPSSALRILSGKTKVFPGVEALAISQDRLLEKRLFGRLGIPAAPYRPVDCESDLGDAAEAIGFPAILKTRRHGYDGKGQALLRRAGELAAAWRRLGGQPAILEGLVPFDRELSVIAVCGRDGETACYCVTENTHRDGILRLSVCRPGDPARETAERRVRRLVSRLGHVGVLALEFFQSGDALLANEFAPRVHNTGHWTIEGAETSQFENHLRAILGLPLGSVDSIGVAASINLIGSIPDAAGILRNRGASLHVYGKAPRPGRKVGHVTVTAESPRRLGVLVRSLSTLIGAEPRRKPSAARAGGPIRNTPDDPAERTPHAPRNSRAHVK